MFEPGDYGYQDYGTWEDRPDHPDYAGDGEWWLRAPDGCLNAARKHTVTVHEDGSITCSPSLVFTSGWHGYLESGVWRQV